MSEIKIWANCYKGSLNLHENSHTRQIEDSKCKYDMMKGFLNSNLNLRKCSSSIQLLRHRHENLLSG